MIDLSVVVVSWNVCELLRRCLRSVHNSAIRIHVPGDASAPERSPAGSTVTCKVIVVDNGSSDGSAAMVQAEFPGVRLVANRRNRGFAAANNQGIALAESRYVLLLNPDTEALGGALAAMVDFTEAHSDVAVVGPRLLGPDGPPALALPLPHAGDRAVRVDLAPADRASPPPGALPRARPARRPARGRGLGARGRAARPARGRCRDRPAGRAVFMSSEELDWCRRFRDAGWRVVYLPAAQVLHHEGKSSEQAVARASRLFPD